jgi:hypothetical protein
MILFLFMINEIDRLKLIYFSYVKNQILIITITIYE